MIFYVNGVHCNLNIFEDSYGTTYHNKNFDAYAKRKAFAPLIPILILRRNKFRQHLNLLHHYRSGYLHQKNISRVVTLPIG